MSQNGQKCVGGAGKHTATLSWAKRKCTGGIKGGKEGGGEGGGGKERRGSFVQHDKLETV